jgi:DNA-binding response OmpR family regulator
VAEREQGKFDLVISDIGLPDGTGLQLMKVLRENYRLKVPLRPTTFPASHHSHSGLSE